MYRGVAHGYLSLQAQYKRVYKLPEVVLANDNRSPSKLDPSAEAADATTPTRFIELDRLRSCRLLY